MRGARRRAQEPWLLIKESDDEARPAAEYDVVRGAARQRADQGGDGDQRRRAAATSSKAAPRRRQQARSDRAATLAGRRREGGAAARLSPQLATLVDEPPPRRRLDLRDQVRRLPPARAHRRRRRAPASRATATTGRARCRRWRRRSRRSASRSAWLDGEIVVARRERHARLPGAAERLRPRRTRPTSSTSSSTCPTSTATTCARVPLVERRALLARLLEREAAGRALRFSEAFDAAPARAAGGACRQAASRASSASAPIRPTSSRRSPDLDQAQVHRSARSS